MNLVILDIDETLLYATESKLPVESDLVVGPYNIYYRPYLSRFLEGLSDGYEIAIWTSSSGDYAEDVVKNLPFHKKPSFVWTRNRCMQKFNPETRKYFYIKDLKKVKRKGYDLNKILIIDDSPEKIYRNYGNHIRVRPFTGDTNDDELYILGKYMKSIVDVDDVRSMEKRGWRTKIQS